MKKGYGSTTANYLFSSYPYQGYPDEGARDKDRKERIDHKAKILVPFKGTSHPTPTFTPNYAIRNDNDPVKKDKDDEQYRGKSLGNWKYNNPNKKGYNGAF